MGRDLKLRRKTIRLICEEETSSPKTKTKASKLKHIRRVGGTVWRAVWFQQMGRDERRAAEVYTDLELTSTALYVRVKTSF